MPNTAWLNFSQFYQKIVDGTVKLHTRVDVRTIGNETVNEEKYISQEIQNADDSYDGGQGFWFNFTSDDADGMVNYYDNLEGPEEVEFRLKPRQSGGKRKSRKKRKTRRRLRRKRRGGKISPLNLNKQRKKEKKKKSTSRERPQRGGHRHTNGNRDCRPLSRI